MIRWRRTGGSSPPEFKREAVALLEGSGRPQRQIAAERGIQPSMLRRWRAAQNGARVTCGGRQVASPADLASENAKLRRELEGTRMERDILKKPSALRGGAEVRFAFIEQHAGAYPVRLLCRGLEVSPSGYYAWRSRPESSRALANLQLVSEIRRLATRRQGRYGSPHMHAALRAEGHRCSRGRVERLMRQPRIRALAGRRHRPCTTDSRHYLAVAPNLLAQRFEASAPDRVWLADITYIRTGEGWLYLAAVLDLATRKIVGWAMRDHMRTELALSALMMAVQRQRPSRGLIHHSGRGSQFAAEALRQAARRSRCRAVHEPHRQLLR